MRGVASQQRSVKNGVNGGGRQVCWWGEESCPRSCCGCEVTPRGKVCEEAGVWMHVEQGCGLGEGSCAAGRRSWREETLCCCAWVKTEHNKSGSHWRNRDRRTSLAAAPHTQSPSGSFSDAARARSAYQQPLRLARSESESECVSKGCTIVRAPLLRPRASASAQWRRACAILSHASSSARP